MSRRGPGARRRASVRRAFSGGVARLLPRRLVPAGLVVAYTAAAAVAFGVPAAFGSTWLLGDNLIQNFPLRVLVGIDLRHGQLPLWDPYLWSGAPLLAGFNAGAAYPATVLFAVLPGALAWVLNQVAVEVVAATGLLVLLRLLGRSWLASGLAAFAFAFGGFMAAQSVHLDLVQAAAWLPWAFVAVDRLARRGAGRSAAPWVALLAAAIGLMILSGAVEPIFDGGIVLALYAAWSAWRTPDRRLDVLLGSASGVGLGVVLAAAQLLPGAAFQSQSQRAMHTFTYFASGSMNKSFTLLGLDPLVLGGSHQWPLSFIGTFNLPEISSYIGILPVMGLIGLLARRHRQSPEAAQWWIWYVILVVGLFLTWGGFTPVAHLVYDIPLYNRQRLLNRNLLEVDLALAVIFATWVDRMFTPALPGRRPVDPHSTEPVSTGPARRRLPPSDVVLPLIPVAAVIAIQLALLVGGPWFPHLLHVPAVVTRARLRPLIAVLCIPSAIALAAGGLVVGRRRIGRRLPLLLTALMVVDLFVFNAGIQATPDPGAASAASSVTANRLAALLAAQGQGPAGGLHRVGMFDPDRYDPIQANWLGQPDLTILRSLDDIQGYGAVVDERYDAETGTHLQLNITPAALSGTTLPQLDLGLLVTVPQYFVHATTGAGTPAGDYDYAAPPAPTAMLLPGDDRTQYFGTTLPVTSVTVPLAAGGSGSLRVGLLSADRRVTTWLGPASSVAGRSGITVTATGAGGPLPAAGLVLLASGAPVTVEAAVVHTAGGVAYRVDGSLRDIVAPSRWHFVGMDGVFCVFAPASASGRAWVSGAPSAAVHVVSDSAWGDETIRVRTARSATLVRSVEFASGWQATVTDTRPTGAAGQTPAPRPAMVRRHGLLQAVTVPAGTHLVRFTYRPAVAYEGLALSALGAVAVILLALWPALWAARGRRRRRRAGGHA